MFLKCNKLFERISRCFLTYIIKTCQPLKDKVNQKNKQKRID